MTLGVNSLPANELSQTLWVDLFPWLDDYVSDRAALLEPLAPSPDWWFSEAPSFTVLEVDLEKVLSSWRPSSSLTTRQRYYKRAFRSLVKISRWRC